MVYRLPTAAPPPSPYRRVARVVLGLSIVAATGAAIAIQVRRTPADFEQGSDSLAATNAVVAGRIVHVGARIADVVDSVLVEEGRTVRQGDLLVRFEGEASQLAVDDAQAAVTEAEAQVVLVREAAIARAHQAASGWLAVIDAQNQVRRQIAQLRTAAASLELRKAERELAQRQYDRNVELAKQRTITSAELEEHSAALDVAKASVAYAEAEVLEARTALGLQSAEDPLEMPSDLADRSELVNNAFDKWLESLAGYRPMVKSLSEDRPKMLELAKQKDFAQSLVKAVDDSAEVKLAQVRAARRREALKLARFQASCAEVRAPVAGTIGKLAIHPGQHVGAGQELMTIGSLDDLWIEASFNPSARDKLRIGQSVAICSVAYPSRVFQGRIAGLGKAVSATNGAASAAPSERPVRIELVGVRLPALPLAIGLPVTSIVDLKAPPSGPLAGEPLGTVAALDEQAHRPASTE